MNTDTSRCHQTTRKQTTKVVRTNILLAFLKHTKVSTRKQLLAGEKKAEFESQFQFDRETLQRGFRQTHLFTPPPRLRLLSASH